MLVKTYGSALNGIDAITVTIEVNIDRGVQFFLVGLPDSAVKESQQRIESALSNNGLKLLEMLLRNAKFYRFAPYCLIVGVLAIVLRLI